MQNNRIEDGIHVPFSTEHGLIRELGASLPGQPQIPLRNRASVLKILRGDLSTERLERIYWMLFLVSNRRNISALHHQLIKGRKISITERANLHLVWYYDKIFIKPVPKYLLSHPFWTTHLASFPKRPASSGFDLEARGFLRTYASLIQHESDFDIAKENRLLPRDIEWEAWCHFIHGFSQVYDSHVAKRYHYGELRLTRLNFWHMILFHGQSYFEVHYNYVTYFSRFGTPYLFVFGAITVVLAALQTALQVYPEGLYRDLASSFIPLSIALTAAGLCSFPLLYILFQLHELWLFLFHNEKPL